MVPNGCSTVSRREAHLLRMFVEPALHGLENVLMFPSGDPSLLAAGASLLDGAALAGIGPVAAQEHSMFFVGVVVGEPFAGRTDVDVFLHDVAKVLLAETALGNEARGHRLGQSNSDAGIFAGQDFLAAEVATVSDGIELLNPQRCLRLLGHR